MIHLSGIGVAPDLVYWSDSDLILSSIRFGEDLRDTCINEICRHGGGPHWTMIREYENGNKEEEEVPVTIHTTDALRYIGEISRILSILHDNNIIHGDLNFKNILVDENKKVRFCDFSNSYYDGIWCHLHGGMPGFAPPEYSRNYDIPPTKEGDIYSLGCIMYYIFSGNIYDRDIRSFTNAEIFIMVDDFKDILISCLSEDPSNRPTCKKILETLRIAQVTDQADINPTPDPENILLPDLPEGLKTRVEGYFG